LYQKSETVKIPIKAKVHPSVQGLPDKVK